MKITIVKCPTCEKPVEWTAESHYRPFCCERCKLIDLGAWADESHRIPETTPPDFSEPSADQDDKLH